MRERADGWRTGAASWLALGVGEMTLKGKDDGIGAFAGAAQDLRRGQVTWLLSFLFYCVTVVLVWVL